jgi:hypothetical protein
MAIDPTGRSLKQLLADDPEQPVVMLNLLRFAEGGRASYEQYAEALSTTFLPRYGGEVLYAGNGDTPRWPTPEYQQVTHLRTEALVEAVLQPTTPLD